MKTTVIQEIASLLQVIENCRETKNEEWFDKHNETLDFIESNYLPSGSGFDCGTKIEREKIQRYADNEPIMITLYFDFHHMDENGMYCGWTSHEVHVKSRFSGIAINISKDCNCENKNICYCEENDCDDDCQGWYCGCDSDLGYFNDEFHHVLSQEIDTNEIHEKMKGDK